MAPRPYLAALQVASYRWLLLNAFAQSAAWTAEQLATGWLVLQLTDSPFWVGAVAATRGLAQVLFSAVGGTIADRTDLRRLLLRNHAVLGLTWAAVVILVQVGQIAIWHLVIAQVVGGVIHAMNAPAHNVLTFAAVGPERMLNAKAFAFLAASVFRIGSALAGAFAIAAYGVQAAYGLVVVSYLLGLGAVVPLSVTTPPTSTERPFASLRAGLRYALRNPTVRTLLALSLVTEMFGFSYVYMLPVVARDVLHVGAIGLGQLSAMAGAGQLVAMIGLAATGDLRRKDLLVIGSTAAFGAAIVLFALAPSFAVALLAVLVIGGTAAVYDSALGTVIQIAVSPEMRGRVLGLLTATWGSNQVGSFGLGALATAWGAPVALALFGGAVVLNTLRVASGTGLRASLGSDQAARSEAF